MESSPVDVWVSASVQGVCDIKTSSQTFGIDVWINCLYSDPTVRANRDGLFFKGMYVDPDKAKDVLDYNSFPVMHWRNNREPQDPMSIIIQVYDEPATGNVIIMRRYFIHCFETMEVRAFPFDRQTLRCEIMFNDCYRLHHSSYMPTGAFGDVTSNEWRIQSDSKGPVVRDFISKIQGKSGSSYNIYEVKMTASRMPQSTLVSYVLPTSILTLLAYPVFELAVGDLASRISAVLTILLTQSALKIVVGSEVPAVNYLTILDKFLIYSFMLTCLVGLECTVVGQRAGHNMDEMALLDLYASRAFLVAWGLLHFLCFCEILRARRNDHKDDARASTCSRQEVQALSPPRVLTQ